MPDFTAEQNAAIEYRMQDACIEAGPGAGKTTVLVERYRSLIEQHGLDPRQILAITFTEKAAANMKAKTAALFAHDEERLRELESAWISTIHGFCARLLRENAIAAGIDPRFKVLDARQADDLQNQCMNAALDEMVAERREEALALMEALQTPRIQGDLIGAFDAIRSAGMTVAGVRDMAAPYEGFTSEEVASRMERILDGWPHPATLSEARRRRLAELRAWARDVRTDPELKCPINMNSVWEPSKPALEEFRSVTLAQYAACNTDLQTAPFRALIFDSLARFEELYAAARAERGALDFNDLERRTIDLLRNHGAVRKRVQDQFRQVMLDEFQDINKQQDDLIRLIRAEHVFFAVGDVNQSIYGFRHSRPHIFREYRAQVESAGLHSARLFDNFRSREEILRCAEGLLNSATGIEARQLRAGKSFADKRGPSIEVLRVAEGAGEDEDGAGMREARWVAFRISEMVRDGLSFRDFAVLCRSHDAMKPFLLEFDRVGIPYVCGSRQSFLLSREGLDITALLHVLANPRDGIALATVLRSRLVGLSDEALLRLKLSANTLTGGLNTLAQESIYEGFSPDDAAKLRRFTADLKRRRAEQHAAPLDLTISRMLADRGFTWTPGTSAGNRVEAFLQLARKFGRDGSLTDFLRELDSMEDAIAEESELSDEDAGNAVQVMTAHAAKGLEFRVTVIAAMQKGARRSGATVTFTPEIGLGLRWKGPQVTPGREGKDGLKDSWAVENGRRLDEREEEEENRLLYVAMTRAEEHLILSWSHDGKKKPRYWASMAHDYFSTPRTFERDGFAPDIRDLTEDPPGAFAHSVEDAQAGKVAEIPLPPDPGCEETGVNVTSLVVFAHCPRKYYLQRHVGWNGSRFQAFDAAEPNDNGGDTTDDDSDLSAAELGSRVHEILAGKPGDYPAEARALADVFFRGDLARRAAGSARSEREWEFVAELGGLLVRGSVDLWFEEGGELYIVDYKTDARADPERYAPQLAFYAMALEKAFGKRPVAGYLHFLRAGSVAEIPLDEEAVSRARALIADLREARGQLRFDLREGLQCFTCPYFRSLCPAGLGRPGDSGFREEENPAKAGIAAHAGVPTVI